MLEDDIQYMGTKLASPPVKLNFNPFSPQPLAGLVMHIEKSSNEDGCRLLFRKANATVIQIGRRPPSNDPAKRQKDSESGRAMFKCPVVSRKHAKITFSDSGFAYIMDLGSHHGTHIRKKDEILSKMLMPHVATMLSDGDTVTFGKSVAKNEGIVRPVVARVELLHTIETPSHIRDGQLKPLVVPEASSPSDAKPVSRTLSGRFYVPSSGSSAGSDSDVGSSDIEEVPAPNPKRSGSQPLLGPTTVASIGRALDAFKSLIPTPTSQSHSAQQRLPPIKLLRPIPVIEFDDAATNNGKDGTSSMEVSACPSPVRSPSPPRPLEPLVIGAWPVSPDMSPIDSPESFIHFESGFDPESQMYNPIDSPTSPFQHQPIFPPLPLCFGFDGMEDEIEKELEKEEEPMDTSGSSNKEADASASENTARFQDLQKPVEYVPGLNASGEDEEKEDESSEKMFDLRERLAAVIKQAEDRKKELLSDKLQFPASLAAIRRKELTEKLAALNAPKDVPNPGNAELRSELDELKAEIQRLTLHRRKLKLRLTNHSTAVLDRIASMQDDIADVKGQCSNLNELVEGAVHFDVPDLQTQIDEIRKRLGMRVSEEDDEDMEGEKEEPPQMIKEMVEELQRRVEALVKEEKEEKKEIDAKLGKAATIAELKKEKSLREEGEKTVNAQLEATIAELKSLREQNERELKSFRDQNERELKLFSEQSERDMKAHLEAIAAAKEDALKAIADAQINAIAAQNEHASSLKRKRSEEDDEPSMDSMMQDISPVTVPVDPSTTSGEPAPKRAKTNRFASAVVKTAGMVTVGAVVTWGALAFS